jgi:Flp pilus assembly pilin Flp
MWWIEPGVQLAVATTARLGLRLPVWRLRPGGRVVGQSTVEYALVGALVVIAAAGALTVLGGELQSVFTSISSTLKTASVAH